METRNQHVEFPLNILAHTRTHDGSFLFVRPFFTSTWSSSSIHLLGVREAHTWMDRSCGDAIASRLKSLHERGLFSEGGTVFVALTLALVSPFNEIARPALADTWTPIIARPEISCVLFHSLCHKHASGVEHAILLPVGTPRSAAS